MAESRNRGRNIVEAAKDVARDVAQDVGGRLAADWIEYGHERASRVALDLVERRISDLHAKVRSGATLPQHELSLLTGLTDLEKELEQQLRDDLGDLRGP